MSVVLRDYQQQAIDDVRALWKTGRHRSTIIWAPTGCHSPGQEILMYDGSSKLVEDVVVGDLLMGPDSTPREVLRLCSGVGEMYRVNPRCGDPWVVNGEHVLTVVDNRSGDWVDITVREFLRSTPTFRKSVKLFRVGVDFSGQAEPLPIDPYLLGVLIGDGCYCNGGVSLCNPDQEVVERVTQECRGIGLVLNVRSPERGHRKSYYLSSDRRGHGCNSLISAMRELSIFGSRSEDKWIPKGYMRSPRPSRLSLLAGLLDTDGYYHGGTSRYIFTSVSRRLADDVVWVARSLGFSSSVHKNENRGWGEFPVYRVRISGQRLHDIPCLVERKKAKAHEYNRDVLRTGFSVESLGTGDYFGFTLDGDGRYLLGDFTVTHNSGKTTIGSEIIRSAIRKGSKVGWLVHRRELVDQASTRLDQFGVDHGIIMRGHPRNLGKQVQVCSVQTLIRRSHVFKPDLIFCDECHRALGETYLTILSQNAGAKLIGLTATPWRTDGRGLGHLFDSIVQCSTPAELTKQGYLVEARVFAPSMPDLAGVKKTAGDYNQKQLAERTDKATLIGDIVDHWKRLADDQQTICFATSVAHSQHIAERFRAAGIAAEHIDGETPLDDRAAILRRLGSGETKVVSNVGVWTEGVDIPVVSCCILARPTQSSGLYLQMAGRILRPHPGKGNALILDHAGCTMQHGFVIDDRECGLDGVLKKPKASNSEESPVGVRICKECYAAFPTTVSICPQCNTPYVIAKQIVEEAGELEEIKPVYTIKNLSRDPRVARIQKIAERMQYKPGWVWKQRQLIQAGLEPQIPEAALRAEYYA